MCNDGIINVFIMQADSPAAAPVHQPPATSLPHYLTPRRSDSWLGMGQAAILLSLLSVLCWRNVFSVAILHQYLKKSEMKNAFLENHFFTE